MGQEDQGERGPFLVPNAVVVAGDDPKPIMPWPNIIVMRLPSRSGIDPIQIHTFDHISKAILLRGLKAKRAIMDLQLATARGKSQRVSRRESGGETLLAPLAGRSTQCGLFINYDFLDDDWRRFVIRFDPAFHRH